MRTKPTPKRRRPTYAFGLVAFVPHPVLRGFYLKTHACVDLVACPTCDAEVYEPCRRKLVDGTFKYISDTHYQRRDAMFGRKR